MERSDSILLRTVRKRPYHDYTAIDHEQEETEDRRRAPRASQDGMGPHNERSDCAESSETPMGSEACRSPAQDHIHMEGSLKGEEKSKPEATPSATLHRSGYILFLTLIYICLAIFSWVVTCYLSFRPITAKHYGAWIWNNDNDGYGWTSYKYLMSLYRKNQRWYHAARVIQSIVGVLTIPLTSAVCSSAAVIFIQKRHARGGLSMRQVITIADKGWTDIPTYIRTFPFFGTKGWKRYGSSFLLLAIFVNLLGLVISPLQEVFLSTRTIKTPTWPSEILFLLDIPDQWAYVNQEPDYTDSNLVVVLTRSALDAATNVQRQAQLWQGANVSCALTDKVDELPLSCDRGGVTFGNMSQLENPFLAQLPGGYSTGLIQQFVPRINSSAQYQNIPGDEFPKACDQVDGAFYVNYLNVTDLGHGYTMTWGLEACMPANVTKSPWNSTRDRQDFTEELYLNVTLIGYEFGIYSSTDANSLLYKITLDTTAGYFELPNYMNGGIAGPLLDKDPNDICGNSCETEGMGSDDI